MIKISEECARSLDHLVFTKGFEKQMVEMFELNPHFIGLIDAIYLKTFSEILKNDPNISVVSLNEIKTGIGLGVSALYQLVRIQMESNDLETNSQ